MGFRDYHDFVQNGQDLITINFLSKVDDEPIEYNEKVNEYNCDTYGSSEAIIVLIPKEEAQDVQRWSLEEFTRFPIHHTKGYSWGDWAFNDVKGYRKFLSSTVNDASVWESKTFPGKILINFEVNTYKAFVKGEVNSNLIPWYYYLGVLGYEVFESGEIKNKQEAYNYIIKNDFQR